MKGITVFEGVGKGNAVVHQQVERSTLVKKETIKKEQIQTELVEFQENVKKAFGELELLKKHALDTVGEEEAEIFEAHIMMLEDPMLMDSIKDRIENELLQGAWAVCKVRDELVEQFMAIDNEYIRARAQDVKDVTDRILGIYLGIEETDLGSIQEDTIMIAPDLKPSETIQLNEFVKGIILEEGSVTSHAAIVAKAKGIPTIVGVTDACSKIQNNDLVILDAKKNTILINPSKEIEEEYQEILVEQKKEQERLKSLIAVPAQTKDGKTIKLYGNVGSVEEAILVKEQGAKGIGLLRTELLYMDNDHFPTEEEQFSYYKKIAELMEEETIIRTLDIGGDKHLPYFDLPKEQNPFLGNRAIRLCLTNVELFKTQLKAILRASHYGKIKIMFPMISCLEELRNAKEILEEAKRELKENGNSFDEQIKVGIMVEIPSVAVSADLFAGEVDFFSIGTNDLCQYTCAVDRMNSEVAHLYQPLHPSILRLIAMTVEAGKKYHVEVGVCGEMAGDKDFATLLMGMGVDELSMSPAMINRVKDKIRNSTFEDMKNLTEKVKLTKTSQEALEIVKEESYVN
ncbi:MAG: phosphoenolpyruvate--protein phosphotransferase [Lachnospiraceae bacterium]|nr:phosphoenolpyruvate--protein phosphotransferase [Lachnospiraceae bacterium]